jgi:hypothetical protein
MKGGIMQKDLEAILLKYKDGDTDQRLHMFLAHRELRDRFTAIDCSDTGDQWTADKGSTEFSGLVEYVMRRLVGALKRFMGFSGFGVTTRKLKKKTAPLQEENAWRKWR